MRIIRIYDDREGLLSELYNGGVIEALVSDDVSIEYCTFKEKKAEKNICFTRGEKGELNKIQENNWDLFDDNNYYIFLDTNWGPKYDYEEDYLFGVPRKLFEKAFRDPRVISVTTYSGFDVWGAMNLAHNIRRYREGLEETDHFPIIRESQPMFYDDDERNIAMFTATLTE